MTDTKPKRTWFRGCMVSLLRLSMVGLFGGVVLALVGVIVAGWLYQEHVVRAPGEHISRGAIRSVIAQESPVYYADGVNRVGVFFDAEHRHYVAWEEIPRAYVMGIVAAEDGAYWGHYGVNPKGIGRAMRDNFLAGKVVAGGSTLTQQTAKNLFYRPDRSAKAKGVELLNALRLEAHYSKSEILTFYVNQFHVTGNGRGLGIAARHFFDKDVGEITVLESAFLAGLVKAPAYYDPFLGDEERRKRSVERAHTRTRYVLQRMVDEPVENLAGPLPTGGADQAAYDARLLEAGKVRVEAKRLLADGFELPFKRGTFRYDSSAILDEVARRMDEPPFDQILAAAGVDDPATAGLKVITTLDRDLQTRSTYGLWHHLTEVGSWMEKIKPEDYLLKDHRGPSFDPDNEPAPYTFRVAKITKKPTDPDRHLVADLGGHSCVIDREAIVRSAVAAERGKAGNKYEKASTATVDAFVEAIPVGGVVLVSVRSVSEDGALCDLEVRPELQGAVMVLQDGAVRAMVGGNDNRNFNRATALRQFGSTWKPVVFHAAMQLGWSPADLLANDRGVFPFSTTFYYPRPDHEPASEVSMSWAGVNSENLASVWLLYHLTDRLDGEQVRLLAKSLGLAREPGEDGKAYRRRMQEMGILATSGRLEESLFLQSRYEVSRSVRSSMHPEDEVAVRAMLYGYGFAAERTRVSREGASSRARKNRALDNSWLHLQSLHSRCGSQYAQLERAFEARRVPAADLVADLTVMVGEDEVKVACGAIPEGYTAVGEELADELSWGGGELEAGVEPAPRWPFARVRPPVLGRKKGPALAPEHSMLVDDRLHQGTLQALADSFERRQLTTSLESGADPYAPEFLYWHQDFRVILAMRYLSEMAEQYGVQTEIQQVLSMPLGASEITLEEQTSVYAGLVTGQTWSFPGKSARGAVESVSTPTVLISEIQDVDGKVLYRAKSEAQQVASPEIGQMSAHILRNVVLSGTGQRAKHVTETHGANLPVGGKTGTTNDFKNAAFLGFAPRLTPEGADPVGGYAVGVYVGYDDNTPMVNRRIKLAGASGALPVWIESVRGLIELDRVGEAPKTSPVAGTWPLIASDRLAVTPAYGKAGVPGAAPEGTGQAGSILVLKSSLAPVVDFEPAERPPRIAPRTDTPREGEQPRKRRRFQFP